MERDQEMYKKIILNLKQNLNICITNAKGAIVRSRVKWHEEGETNSKYFIGLEKKIEKFNCGTQIKNWEKMINIDEILIESVGYYHSSTVQTEIPGLSRNNFSLI